MCAFILGLFFRVASGEPFIGLPALIEYPMFKEGKQRFPFRILCMVISAVTLLSISALTNWLFDCELLHRRFDIFKIVERREGAPRKDVNNDIVLQNSAGGKYTKKDDFNDVVLENKSAANEPGIHYSITKENPGSFGSPEHQSGEANGATTVTHA